MSGLLTGEVLGKYLPVLVHKTIDFCQVMIVGNIRAVVGIGMGMVAAWTLTKVGLIGGKMYKYSRELKTLTVSVESEVITFRGEQPEAFCLGIFRPRIYISTGMIRIMNKAELATVLRHEQYHLSHQDPLIFLIAYITQSLFPFFPIVADLMSNYRTEREIMADKQAGVGDNANTLRRVLQKLIAREPRTEVAFAPAISAHETLETRVRVLTGESYKRKKMGLRQIIISVAALIIMGLSITIPLKIVEIHSEGVDTVNACYYTV
jgi:beta-lactamase regulating signal transducer with metallopeptidase domain